MGCVWKYERSKLDRMFRVAKDFRVDQVSIFSPKKWVEVKKTRLWSWKSEGGSGKSAEKDADSSTAARRQSVEGYLINRLVGMVIIQKYRFDSY
jgi:hypothetical protein